MKNMIQSIETKSFGQTTSLSMLDHKVCKCVLGNSLKTLTYITKEWLGNLQSFLILNFEDIISRPTLQLLKKIWPIYKDGYKILNLI